MRVRKPCVRARLTLEGWYVRFMINPAGYFLRSCDFKFLINFYIRQLLAKSTIWQGVTHALTMNFGIPTIRETHDYRRFLSRGNSLGAVIRVMTEMTSRDDLLPAKGISLWITRGTDYNCGCLNLNLSTSASRIGTGLLHPVW